MLQKCSVWKVARIFFDEPKKEHYLMEISRKSSLSHTSVKNHLKTLKEKNLVGKEEKKRGERTYPIYKSNLENEEYKNFKKVDMIRRLHEIDLIKHLESSYQPNCIVLFGSAARGEDTEESDVDLYIQAEERTQNNEGEKILEFEEKLNREIQLHVKPDFSEYPEELKNNIANGTVLYGYLEIF